MLNIKEANEEKRRSYSEVTEGGKESVIIIKPKEAGESSSDTTKSDLKKNINVTKLGVGITKIKKATKGAVVVGCKNKAQASKLKEKVIEDLGDKYIIQDPARKKLKIKIFDVNNEDCENEDDLWRKIEEQNEFVKGSIGGRVLRKLKSMGSQRVTVIAEVKKEAAIAGRKNKTGMEIVQSTRTLRDSKVL